MNRFAILGAMGVAVILAALLLNYVINRDELGDTGTPAPAVTTAPSAATTAPSGSTAGGAQAPTTQGSTTQGSTTEGSTNQGSTTQAPTTQSTESQGSSSQGSATQGTTAQGSSGQGSGQGSTGQGSTDQGSTAQEATTQGAASQGATNQSSVNQGSTSQDTTSQGSTSQGSTGQGTTNQPSASAGSSGQSAGTQPTAPSSTTATTPSNGSAGNTTAAGSNPASTGTTAPAISSAAAPAANQTASIAAPTGGSAAPAPPPPIRPSFDIVRVNPDGGTVIAGRAAPRATVTITADGQKIGTVVADDRGEWVILPTSKLVPGNHQIAIASQLGGAAPVASDDVVIVVVPQPPAAAKAASGGGGTQTAAAAAPQQPLAVVVPRTDQGSTVLQSPNPPQSGQLVLQSVDYDAEGRVVIGGRAGPGKEVRAYLDNRLVGSVKSDSSGVWHIIPDRHVLPGLHTLRIDEVDDSGKVLARVESPFSRAEPLSIGAGDQVVVVQPGNNLWLIATRTYGSGPRYTVIYQANKAQIKNPDLIYPGQVFELPTDTP